MSMYLDLDSYADYIAAYKTYMVDTARVMVRELGTGVSDEQLAMVGSCFATLFDCFNKKNISGSRQDVRL